MAPPTKCSVTTASSSLVRLLKPRFRSEVLFERICRENDITQSFTKVASPTTTGKIERLHLTMRLDLLDDLPPFRPLTLLLARRRRPSADAVPDRHAGSWRVATRARGVK